MIKNIEKSYDMLREKMELGRMPSKKGQRKKGKGDRRKVGDKKETRTRGTNKKW